MLIVKIIIISHEKKFQKNLIIFKDQKKKVK